LQNAGTEAQSQPDIVTASGGVIGLKSKSIRKS
jgi:hypothetical protein